jgi:hypothetical protein
MHKAQLYNVRHWTNVIRANKSRKIRWAGHVERKNKCEMYKNLSVNLKEPFRSLKKIEKNISKVLNMKETELIWLRI